MNSEELRQNDLNLTLCNSPTLQLLTINVQILKSLSKHALKG